MRRLALANTLLFTLAGCSSLAACSTESATSVTPSTQATSAPTTEATTTTTTTTTTTPEPTSTVTTIDTVTTVDTVDGRYVDEVFAELETGSAVVYATAPALVTGTPEDLLLDWYAPADDDLAARPVIVWVHGGGFRVGNRGTLADTAAAYARRGYVTLTIDYRLDPGSLCQDVQDEITTDPADRIRCVEAIAAAQHDAQAAVRWVRANAEELGADTNRIAIGGFSAGAVTAVHVAQRSDDPGDVGEHLDQPSTVSLALVASGCSFFPGSIDATDPPMSLLASEFDQAVPFSCVDQTAQRSRGVDVVVETLYYMSENGHARGLYLTHQLEVDAAWTAFLVEHLHLIA